MLNNLIWSLVSGNKLILRKYTIFSIAKAKYNIKNYLYIYL